MVSATLFIVGFAAIGICLSMLTCILIGCTSASPPARVTLTFSGDPHPGPLLHYFNLPLPGLRSRFPIPLLSTIPPRQSQRQPTFWRSDT